MCTEWTHRGFNDDADVSGWAYELLPMDGLRYEDWPWWFGHPEMVRTHRSKLIRKLPSRYKPIWGHSCVDHTLTIAGKHRLPYLWPDPIQRNGFRLSLAEQKRGGYTVPHHWKIDDKTRKVEFE
jgi:hypothetical protein